MNSPPRWLRAAGLLLLASLQGAFAAACFGAAFDHPPDNALFYWPGLAVATAIPALQAAAECRHPHIQQAAEEALQKVQIAGQP